MQCIRPASPSPPLPHATGGRRPAVPPRFPSRGRSSNPSAPTAHKIDRPSSCFPTPSPSPSIPPARRGRNRSGRVARKASPREGATISASAITGSAARCSRPDRLLAAERVGPRRRGAQLVPVAAAAAAALLERSSFLGWGGVKTKEEGGKRKGRAFAYQVAPFGCADDRENNARFRIQGVLASGTVLPNQLTSN
ncbi:hypothetical protein BS78_05G114300 [Paspalum vaginatum]|nr:hypothetical protein BS78_05G114300 [Paspalum vaginatum]